MSSPPLDSKNPFSPGISSSSRNPQGSPQHNNSNSNKRLSNNPFQADNDKFESSYSSAQQNPASFSPQTPRPPVIRQVNPGASHYNNYSLPKNNIGHTAIYSPPASDSYNVPSITATAPSINNESTFEMAQYHSLADSEQGQPQQQSPHRQFPHYQQQPPHHQNQDGQDSHMSSQKNRPTSADVYNSITRQQQHISFALNEDNEINLSNDGSNFSNSPGFLAAPHNSNSENDESNSTQPPLSDLDSNVMKRTRWGTQRHKKGRPKNDLKRNKSKMSKKRISSATSHHSSLSINDQSSDSGKPDTEDPEKGVHRIFFNMKVPEDMIDPETGLLSITYPRNKIRTTKYTPLSFFPKNLYFQFKNIANIYFLFIVILGVCAVFYFFYFSFC